MIMAAANKLDVFDEEGTLLKTITLVDSCHMGRNMQGIMSLLRDLNLTYKPAKEDYEDGRSQGFIDSSCNYLSRGDAYKVASSSGQLFNSYYTLPGDKLDSSCIRHFPKEADSVQG